MKETITIEYADDLITVYKSNLGDYYLTYANCSNRIYLPQDFNINEFTINIDFYRELIDSIYGAGFKDGFKDGRNQLKHELKNIFCEEE